MLEFTGGYSTFQIIFFGNVAHHITLLNEGAMFLLLLKSKMPMILNAHATYPS